jgi:hypothetical protein
MKIRKIFQSVDEYFDYVWKFISIKDKWTPEQRDAFNLFFKYEQESEGDFSHPRDPETQKSIDAYLAYYKGNPDETRHDIYDINQHFDEDDLAYFFYFRPPHQLHNDDADDELYDVIDSPEKLIWDTDRLERPDGPFMFNGIINWEFDRCGKIKMIFSDIITLKEFTQVMKNNLQSDFPVLQYSL